MNNKKVITFILLAILLSACAGSTTPEVCASATENGANERFTFEEITPCLDTPETMIAFLQNNMQWVPDWDETQYGGNVYSTASEVFQNGADDCDGMAEFIACTLSKNGYEAYNVGISVTEPWGFNVAGYVGEDGLKYAITNNPQPDGPFETWEELAQHYIDLELAKPDSVVWLFKPCISERVDGDAVLELEHQVIR